MFLLVISVPIFTMFLNSYLSSQQMLERKYTDLLSDVSKQSNIRIEEFLEDTRKISLISSYGINSYVSAVSQENYPMQNYLLDDSKRNENQAIQLLNNYITMKDNAFSVYVYNLNGGKDLYISTNKTIDFTYHPKDEVWFQQFLASDDITGDVPTLLDKQTKWEENWAILNLRKIFDMNNGNLIGVMVISIDIDFVDKLNQRLQEDSRSAFTIVDENDKVIFNSNYEWLGQSFTEFFPLDTKQMAKDSNREIVSADGEDYILIRTPFEAHRWTSYLYMPVNDLALEGDILKRNLIYVVIGLLLFTLISSFYLSNLITRPIKSLMNNMLLVEKGKFDNLQKVRSNDEIGLLANRFEKMSGELKQLVERIYLEEQEKTEAEIRALQAQINPHFLYNTLNSLKWIATMQRSDKIVEMTEALISILRYSSKNDSRLVTIREELLYIEHYFTIQKVRYFNKITVHYEIDETLLDTLLPKLTIQPIVENAIFHGIADIEDEGIITIKVCSVNEQTIAIIVADNGRGMDEQTSMKLLRQLQGGKENKEDDGIGVRNVHYRIQRRFGLEYGLQFSSELDEGSQFTITIPRSQ